MCVFQITDVYLSEGLQTPIVLTKKLRHDIESIQSRFAKNPKVRGVVWHATQCTC